MGNAAPVITAFFLNLYEVCFFVTSTTKLGCEPLLSSMIFLLALTIFVLESPLLFLSFWKFCGHCTYILQFFAVMFTLEYCMSYFWFVLEDNLMWLIPKLVGSEVGVGTECSKLPVLYFITSYTISLSFLITILHIKNYIDVRLLRVGLFVFLYDIQFRIKQSFEKLSNFGASNPFYYYQPQSCCSCTDGLRISKFPPEQRWDYAGIYRPR